MMDELSDDPFNLARFVLAQRNTYDSALSEIEAGRKRSHWMWFIFPQFAGLGLSYESELYAINSLNEARAYQNHPVLGPRLVEISDACLKLKGKTAFEVFGTPDDLKLCSSMTLFSRISSNDSAFHRLLATFYDGKVDQRTLELIAKSEINP